MPPLTNARIEKGTKTNRGQSYYIKADEGYMNVDLTPDGEEYKIGFYRARDAYQGQGYGRELLKLAKEHAKSLGAKAITSTEINSDKSAEAMSDVFGQDSLTTHIDPYNLPSLASLSSMTTLGYTVQETDPPLREDVATPEPRPSATSPIYRYFEQRTL